MARLVLIRLGAVSLVAIGAGVTVRSVAAQCPTQPSAVVTAYPQHSMDRPQPAVVTPGPAGAPVAPPSDAIVLFDGRDLSQWRNADSVQKPAGWKLVDGTMEVVEKSGDIRTARSFGDVQLHVEWRAPLPAEGEGQERGNSGVYLMGMFEVQVLDSYKNPTYADGAAGSVFGQYPPLVNAARAPGEWQTYDIIFRAPRFGPDGSLKCAARVTVVWNGALVQNDVVLSGPTAYKRRPPYAAGVVTGPVLLQDHGHPVRYREIWVRELQDGGM